MFHTFDIFYVVLHFKEWLYNAVGFAVRCDRSTAALTCIKIIPPIFAPICLEISALFSVISLYELLAETLAETAQISLKSHRASSYPIGVANLPQIGSRFGIKG